MRALVLALAAFLGLVPLGAAGGAGPEIFPQTGHIGWVRTATLSQDGKRLLSGGWSGLIKLWEVRSGREIRTMKGDSTNIMGLVFSPDGLRAASFGMDYNIILWDLQTGEALHTWPMKHGLGGEIAFVAHGRQILFQRMEEVRILDTVTGRELAAQVFPVDGLSDHVIASPDGRFSFTIPGGFFQPGQAQRSTRLWDFRNQRVLREIPQGVGYPVSFTPDGNRLLSHMFAEGLVFQETFTGRVLWTARDIKTSPDKMLISGDSSRAVTMEKNTARVWDLGSGRVLQGFPVPSGMMLRSLSRDGQWALFGDDGFDNLTFRVYETLTGQEVAVVNEKKDEGCEGASFSPDGAGLVLVKGATPVLRDLRTQVDQTFQGNGRDIFTLACAPDRPLALLGDASTFSLWDLALGTCLRTVKSNGMVVSAAFAAGGETLATGSGDGTLQLWNPATGQERAHADAHKGAVLGVAFSPDGSLLATAGNDALVKVWDGRTGALLRTLHGHLPTQPGVNDRFIGVNAVAFSPDGRLASAGSDGTLRIWDAASGKELSLLQGPEKDLMAVAFAGKGRYLVSGSRNGKVRLWEPGASKESRVLHTMEGMVSSVVCPDGRTVAVRAGGESIKVWNADTWKEIQQIQGDPNFLQQASGLTAIALSADSRHLLACEVGSVAARLWDLSTGKEMARFLRFDGGEWITLLPEGYFQASPGGARNLNVRTGIEVGSVDQFFSRFYRPELVQLALGGQALPEGENLTDIASRKPAPEVAITSPQPGTEVDEDHVAVAVEVRDAGGGIGPVQVFLNGTQVANGGRGLAVKEGSRRGVSTLMFTVPLAHGVNEIRAVASNGDNSMESVPAAVTVRSRAVMGKPDFHALVVGIDRYRNQSISLIHAASDAQAFGEALRKSASPLFERTRVQVLATPEETTREAIIKAFETLVGQVRPNDVFVFYDASHGVVDLVEGEEQYFLLTSNVLLLSSNHLGEAALSQKDLARLIGAIPAQKKIVFLDTCNAGKGGREIQAALLQQTRGLTESTAIKVLQRSIGSAVFSASSDTEAALEGYRGHGLFTFFLIEGLQGKADGKKEGFVTVRGLADYVEEQVVTVSEQVFKRQQTPTIQTSGNFPIAKVMD